jgi:hypothetical protein
LCWVYDTLGGVCGPCEKALTDMGLLREYKLKAFVDGGVGGWFDRMRERVRAHLGLPPTGLPAVGPAEMLAYRSNNDGTGVWVVVPDPDVTAEPKP